ncbi:DUF427 domain-containing protein [Segniliparus rugosus]|uniref:DUF427 domain-containing protein n=1 Tax=Segniliparus rugosus (strain ATCC BAA-974 / DSM 45345 / CCUG 50838 / CIP 108380 / JCM 13579 / CDC 945) TaxID=679197 RepID=E5XNT9_SEGRC|nr:DUF427 domain-containing protein [Segniliparus rugosus]EFV13967.1 hypothetical protein HMPREF9336_01160 [Segniliparus rugosus ATCC BAA-974]
MAREPRLPGPDHPIAIEPSSDHVVVRVGGVVIAESEKALVLREAAYPPVYYLPASAADWSALRGSATNTYCPYKGEASHYDVVTEAGTVLDAAWSYPEPYPSAAAIAGRLAFYPDRTQISVAAPG